MSSCGDMSRRSHAQIFMSSNALENGSWQFLGTAESNESNESEGWRG